MQLFHGFIDKISSIDIYEKFQEQDFDAQLKGWKLCHNSCFLFCPARSAADPLPSVSQHGAQYLALPVRNTNAGHWLIPKYRLNIAALGYFR